MSPTYKRWYDHDPLLLEVIELLRNYQTELRAQAEIFLQKIEEKVSKETIDKFYAMVKPVNANNRWYDKDPVISRTVEILRIVPPGSGLYSGLYILPQTGITFEMIESIICSEDYVHYISLLKNYKNGGYYTFNSKDLEVYINYEIQARYGRREDNFSARQYGVFESVV